MQNGGIQNHAGCCARIPPLAAPVNSPDLETLDQGDVHILKQRYRLFFEKQIELAQCVPISFGCGWA